MFMDFSPNKYRRHISSIEKDVRNKWQWKQMEKSIKFKLKRMK